jgi:(S)-mandelate dehydrogenase
MSRRIDQALNIDELREIARRRLPRFAFDYVDGGSEDEATLAGNRASFERLRFRPRTLIDVSVRDTSTRILGQPASFPAIVGPTGLNGLQWPDGDLAIARAAAAAGLPFAMSTVSMSYIEDLVKATSGRLWLQAYVFREREISDRLIDRAAAAGCEAIIITSDFPTAGKR